MAEILARRSASLSVVLPQVPEKAARKVPRSLMSDRQPIVGEHESELARLDGGEEILPSQPGYVCSRCQQGKHQRCDEIDCECCSGQP